MVVNIRIFVVTMLITCNCKSNIEVRDEEKAAPIKFENNCIELVHPKWVDEITPLDEDPRKNYNGMVLYSFLKNVCIDTIQIELNELGLHIGGVDWHFNHDSLILNYRAENIISSYINIPPGDSTYLHVAEFNGLKKSQLDSARISIAYKKNRLTVEQYATVLLDGI